MTAPVPPARGKRLVEFAQYALPPRFVVIDRTTGLYLAGLLTEDAREAHCIRAGYWPMEPAGEDGGDA